ncbi:MAG: ankyrin repeat domain-containing protein [Gemmatimonadaceae bacterium]|nr:ankyrin repeat domain-containing protein [Gemmatimonadaceae bacterium]
MPVRWLPVYPNLDQLKHQAKDLLRAMHAGDPAAIAELREHHPDPIEPPAAKLADAQLVLARSYEASSWTRLVQAVELVDAIWRDDLEMVRGLVTTNPKLLHEPTLIRKNSNWGPPMTYAANVGRDRIIQMLHGIGAIDLESAMGRAALQGKIGTAKMLHAMLGKPVPPDGALGGPAYTLSAEGTALLLDLGVRVRDAAGKLLAPVDVVIQTDGRNPSAKHAILEMYERHGVEFPDTPPMALHRGRIDLLEEHLRRDPGILGRTFSHRDIYPAEMGCGDEIDATVGTPLGGTTLLHMCVDYDEMEIARWLLDKGMDVNARAAVGDGGFGGYTALFATVVSQPNFWMNHNKRGPFVAPLTRLLLEHGADPNARASLWKRLHPGHGDDARHEYRNVTALSWGRRFHAPIFVSEPAMRLIEEAGGVE